MLNASKKSFPILKELGINIEITPELPPLKKRENCAKSPPFFASIYYHTTYCRLSKTIYYFDKNNNLAARGNFLKGKLLMKKAVFFSSPGLKEKIILNFIYLRNIFYNYFPLHANVLFFGKSSSILISGPSGGGKSTLSHIISKYNPQIREYLEDIVYLNKYKDILSSICFQIISTNRAHQLIIDSPSRDIRRRNIKRKKAGAIQSWPRQTAPKLIIFTQTNNRQPASFTKLNSREVFTELMKNSYLRVKSRKSPVYRNQIETFLFTSKVKSYKTILGRNTKNRPGLLYKMIKGAVEDVVKTK